MPTLTINGDRREFAAEEWPETLETLLNRLGFKPERVVAEVDGEVVARARFAAFPLRDGQVVELVSFVGGG